MNGLVQDIKDSIEQSGIVSRLGPSHIIACLGSALVCGLIIYAAYKFFYRGAVYSESFNVLNIMTCMVTSFIIMTIASNLVLSLGMVGALSIVRFRAAIKDPLDIGFLFLAIAAGLTSGAGLYPVALIGTMSVVLVYILLSFLQSNKKSFLLVVKYSDGAKDSILKTIKPYGAKLKSVISYGETTELTVTVRIKGINTVLLDFIRQIDGVTSAVLMEYVGD